MVKKLMVCVKWFDSSFNSGTYTQEELDKKNKKYILEDIGWLAHEDEEHLTLATSWVEENKEWRYVHHVPKVNILDRKEIREEEL